MYDALTPFSSSILTILLSSTSISSLKAHSINLPGLTSVHVSRISHVGHVRSFGLSPPKKSKLPNAETRFVYDPVIQWIISISCEPFWSKRDVVFSLKPCQSCKYKYTHNPTKRRTQTSLI